jgi:hypothetical protein
MLTIFTMLGTFIWGAVLFYKTTVATCYSPLWTCMNVYYLGVWITTGICIGLWLLGTAALKIEENLMLRNAAANNVNEQEIQRE